jgi:hypothetical protein
MKYPDGYRRLSVELIYRAKSNGRLRSGHGANWRQYRLTRHWHIKIVWRKPYIYRKPG